MPLTPDRWHQHVMAALNWLERSMIATRGQGSAHSWSPVWGWAGAYPETTGYLVETLLKYSEILHDETLAIRARASRQWLIEIQLPNGAWAGGMVGGKTPSVFNTAQILFAFDENNGPPAVASAATWLLELLEKPGGWKNHAYVKDFEPTYYTRVVWPLLRANRWLKIPGADALLRSVLHRYAERFLNDGFIRDAGFFPEKPAFTHTLAYTLEGFLECAILLNEPEILSKTENSARHLLDVRQLAGGRTAGRYAQDWKGDYGFICPVGNAQLSCFYHRLFQVTGDVIFQEAAQAFLQEILNTQVLDPASKAFGALPGSAPFWGPYMRFKYPNWAVKFFLDALAYQSPAASTEVMNK